MGKSSHILYSLHVMFHACMEAYYQEAGWMKKNENLEKNRDEHGFERIAEKSQLKNLKEPPGGDVIRKEAPGMRSSHYWTQQKCVSHDQEKRQGCRSD